MLCAKNSVADPGPRQTTLTRDPLLSRNRTSVAPPAPMMTLKSAGGGVMSVAFVNSRTSNGGMVAKCRRTSNGPPPPPRPCDSPARIPRHLRQARREGQRRCGVSFWIAGAYLPREGEVGRLGDGGVCRGKAGAFKVGW